MVKMNKVIFYGMMPVLLLFFSRKYIKNIDFPEIFGLSLFGVSRQNSLWSCQIRSIGYISWQCAISSVNTQPTFEQAIFSFDENKAYPWTW